MDQDALRLVIRRKLASSTLPHDSIQRFWGGPAAGEECDACEALISTGQLVMEGISATKRGYQFHVECFAVWDAERDVPGRT
jgi:hypothetical protein